VLRQIDLLGSGLSVSTFLLLNICGWIAFHYVGLAMLHEHSELRRPWWCLFLGMVLSSTLGSTVAYRLIRGDQAMGWWDRLRSGSETTGYFGGPLLFLMWTAACVAVLRIKAYPFLDVFSIAYSVSRAISKVACFAAGCCYGRPTNCIFGLARSRLGDPTLRHPVQLYEASLHLLTALCLGILYARGRLRGRLVIVLGLTYGLGRLLIEPLRGSHPVPFLGGPLTAKQMVSLFVVAFSATYLLLDRVGMSRIPEHGLAAGHNGRSIKS
jgi:prolipoprotein diacylglyceryltransferase